ncbi:MAG: thioredoxin-dependent thiol peroxidase [Spirochaetes bacterium]|nr:thioredoxin-dependent thiol peroxidase [Spirochaetota bacterium]MBU1080370.1 thioredoxin-dependent thiol peroxidase [Spirochaetota bacterium]
MLAEGSLAPDFTLQDDEGKPVSLSSYRGKTVVVYFYPKDDTPGCTKEACGFRDAYDLFLAKGAVVIGVSPDKPASHGRFRAKHGLPFVLLADPEHSVLEAYGAWGEKSMYGKKYMGVVRSTVVVAPDGSVLKAFPKVSPEGHAAEILAEL